MKTNTLFDIFSRTFKLKRTEGTFGIEIETETESVDSWPQGFFTHFEDPQTGQTKYEVPIRGWEAHVDGSLRNFGMEFVLESPLSFEDSVMALNNFGIQTKDVKFIEKTPSTSVHVHVNMSNETPLTLANFLTTYILIENILTEYSGECRRSNLFSLPIRVARRTLENLISMTQQMDKGIETAISWNQNEVKYAAINIGRLSSLGSIEIRCFRGETDVEEIKLWLGLINNILLFSKREGMTPRDILSHMESMSESELLDMIFKDMSSLVRERVPEYKPLMSKNFLPTAIYATCVPSWEDFGGKFEIKEPKPPKPKMSGLVPGMVLIDEFSDTVLQDFMPLTEQPWIGTTLTVIEDEDDD